MNNILKKLAILSTATVVLPVMAVKVIEKYQKPQGSLNLVAISILNSILGQVCWPHRR